MVLRGRSKVANAPMDENIGKGSFGGNRRDGPWVVTGDFSFSVESRDALGGRGCRSPEGDPCLAHSLEG